MGGTSQHKTPLFDFQRDGLWQTNVYSYIISKWGGSVVSSVEVCPNCFAFRECCLFLVINYIQNEDVYIPISIFFELSYFLDRNMSDLELNTTYFRLNTIYFRLNIIVLDMKLKMITRLLSQVCFTWDCEILSLKNI